MTKPRALTHRPGCDQPEPRSARVGSWWIDRCPTCRATGARKATTETTEEDR